MVHFKQEREKNRQGRTTRNLEGQLREAESNGRGNKELLAILTKKKGCDGNRVYRTKAWP